MGLDGKVILVTEGTGSVSREIALLFAQQGARVVLCGHDARSGKATAAAIQKQGGRARFLLADVSLAADVKGVVEEAIATYGRLDGLLVNAGLSHPQDRSFLDTSEAVWDVLLERNLRGTYLCCQQALPFLVKSGLGSIVVLAMANPHRLTARVSQAGVEALIQAIAAEFGPQGVRANVLCPAVDGADLPLARRAVQMPLANCGSVPQAALFLASANAAYINGATLWVPAPPESYEAAEPPSPVVTELPLPHPADYDNRQSV